MIMLEHGDKVLVAVFPGADLLCIVHDVSVDVLVAEVRVVGEFDQGVLDVLPCAFFFEKDTGDFVPDGVNESRCPELFEVAPG